MTTRYKSSLCINQVKQNPRHPKYDKETTEYDFSLLELEEDMDFDDEAVGPACLPKDASNKFVGVTGESKILPLFYKNLNMNSFQLWFRDGGFCLRREAVPRYLWRWKSR